MPTASVARRARKHLAGHKASYINESMQIDGLMTTKTVEITGNVTLTPTRLLNRYYLFSIEPMHHRIFILVSNIESGCVIGLKRVGPTQLKRVNSSGSPIKGRVK